MSGEVMADLGGELSPLLRNSGMLIPGKLLEMVSPQGGRSLEAIVIEQIPKTVP